MLDYFRILSIGDTVDLEELSRRMQTNTNGLVSLDAIGGRGLFKKVWVRKGLPGSATDERRKVIAKTYFLSQDQFASLGTLNITFL